MKYLFRFASLTLTVLMVGKPIPAAAQVLESSSDLRIRVVSTDAAAGAKGRGLTVEVADPAGAGVPEAAVVVRLADEGITGVFGDGTHAAVAYTDASGLAQVPPIHWTAASGSALVRITASKGSAHAGTLVDATVTSGALVSAVPVLPVASNPVPAAPVVPVAAPTVAAPAPVQPGKVQMSNDSLVLKPRVSPGSEPTVSVVNRSKRDSHDYGDSGGSRKKWIILAIAIAAGAGAGLALAGKGKSSSSSSSSSSNTGVTIGSPTVSVGAPH